MTPENKSARRIAIENLKPGMVLAMDLVDADQNLVLKSGSVLDKENFNTIMLNSSQYVYVLEESISAVAERIGFLESVKDDMYPLSDIPVQERDSFRHFSIEFADKPMRLAKAFKQLVEGEPIGRDELYAIADNLMDHLKTKNDIMIYVNHLKATGERLHVHSINVALLANLFGIWVNYDRQSLEDLTVAALLHDIGKTQLPTEIINKNTADMDPDELAQMKKHPSLGYRILDNANMPEEIKLAALSHHERMDGSGYPLGLKGEKISKFAKIIAVCDVYDTMTTEKFGSPPICPFDAIKQFERDGYGNFDTETLLLFLQNIAYTYLNARVALSDGSYGRVVFINSDNMSRPIIVTDDERVLDLRRHKELMISALA